MNLKNVLHFRLKKEPKQIERIKVTSFFQYRKLQNESKNHLDFSDFPDNTDNIDIQNLNLENLGLNIDLRKISVPYNRYSFYRYLKPTSSLRFLRLNHSNLKGNNVEGNLSPFQDNRFGKVYFWYSEDTFDETYKKKYNEFFLSQEAPEELKEKYYNPVIKDFVIREKASGKIVEKGKCYSRQTLTFNEFLKYYEFLKGKTLDNFKITEKEKIMITIADYYGLEKAKEILERLSNINLPIFITLLALKRVKVEEIETILLGNAIQNKEFVEKITYDLELARKRK